MIYYGLWPSTISLIFLLILIIVYLKKYKEVTLSSKLYNFFLINAFIYNVVIIVSTFYLVYINDDFIFSILWRITLFFSTSTWIVYYLYGVVVIYAIEDTKIKNIYKYNYLTKLIFWAMCGFLVYLIPVKTIFLDYITKENIEYYSIAFAAFNIVVTIMSNIYYIYILLKRKNDISKNFIFSSSICIIMSTINLLFQSTNRAIAILPVTYTIICYTTYFMYENPDLKFISKKNEIEKEINSHKDISKIYPKIDYKILGHANNVIEEIEKIKINQNEQKENIKNNILNKNEYILETMENIINKTQIEMLSSDRNNLSEIDMQEFINEIENWIEQKLKNNIKLEINVDEKIPKKIKQNHEIIYYELTKIIEDSMKSTKIGKITLSFNMHPEQNELTITISDTSDGEQENKNIKNEFVNENKNTLESIGVSLEFESQYMVGNKYVIKIPIQDTKYDEIGEIVKVTAEKDYSNLKALIVDDSEISANITRKILERHGVNVITVNSGLECINLIKSDEKYSIVFMDIEMKEIDGIEVLKVLNEMQDFAIPPVVALTANSSPQIKKEYKELGFSEYLSKPIKEKNMLKILEKTLIDTNK